MDSKMLQQYGIEEAVRRLQQINEYTLITRQPLAEDGDDDPFQQQDSNGQQPPQGGQGGQNGGSQQPQMPQGGGMQGGQLDAQQQTTDDSGQQPPTGGQGGAQQPPMPMNGGQQPQQPPMGMDDPMQGGGEDISFDTEEDNTDGIQPGDEVIDVDDLTQSQEEAEEKIDGVNKKLTDLLTVVKNFQTAIDQNDDKIEDLKKEIARRNPTPEERLNLRSQDNYPYSESPKDYWEKKTKENPNYAVMYDNGVPTSEEDKEFKIRRGDIDNLNYNEIADTFDRPMRLSDFM